MVAVEVFGPVAAGGVVVLGVFSVDVAVEVVAAGGVEEVAVGGAPPGVVGVGELGVADLVSPPGLV
ncbi:hypothetical protein P186_0801 [Pyrobaculum ferrireducens]|uniref:Uncharacterized protein n=1 Tax=Pyrobaculum ferrireducens TaxID=1104324 RepID=G7VAK9_9CREN|nr:hypothetical protein P186_0801 [Pyrobaculum ferrireducens]